LISPGADALIRTLAAIVAAAALAALGAPAVASAQSAENVAVVINDASPASQQIGEYYVKKRGIPPENIIHIKAPTDDEVRQVVFTATIQAPIALALTRADLQDRILYIVLTKGIPLRIAGTPAPNGTVASVDSELTLLYRRMTGVLTRFPGPLPNPYYLNKAAIAKAGPFTHSEFDIYLVTRLDGFSVEDVEHLIDRSMAPATHGRVVLDEKATLFNRTGEDWLEEAAKRLSDMGFEQQVLLDKDAAPVRNVKDAIGYYSWASNDPANRVRNFGVEFVPGALAATFVSSDARTFQEPPSEWKPTSDWNDKKSWFAGSPQTLSGDLIREGVTGVAGQVAEPLLGATVRPQILFPAYFAGRNLAESYYLAIPYLSWQTVVIGDPLCRPFPATPVDASDLNPPVVRETGLPKFFSARSVDAARAVFAVDSEAQALLGVRAQARLAKGDRAGAKTDYAELVKASPASLQGQLRLADLLNADREYDAALEHYRAALRIEPNNILALNNAAYILGVQKHSLDEAKAYADQANRLAPRDPNIADTAGWVAYLAGEYQRASRLLAQAVAGIPGNAEIRLHAAFAYQAAGARAAALNELQNALKLNPKIADREEVRELQRKLGK
jgi:uncharacterized protein (TIGR03790 family)